jgi:hypothetical protein
MKAMRNANFFTFFPFLSFVESRQTRLSILNALRDIHPLVGDGPLRARRNKKHRLRSENHYPLRGIHPLVGDDPLHGIIASETCRTFHREL